MSKKETKKIRPSDCVQSLEKHNEVVLSLLLISETLIKENAVDPQLAPMFKKWVEELRTFYTYDE